VVKRAVYVLAALAALGAGAMAAAARPEPPFPHLSHERLFPVCEGCHAGVLTGAAEAVFPQPADCARCHDGTRAERVAWREQTSRATNLRFSHPEHLERTTRSGEPVVCLTCHAAGDEPSRMNVGAAQPERCIQCHEHAADAHLETATQCSRCHVPLASATALSLQQVARFPQPLEHAAADWAATHGSMAASASCAVCHARESCARCHPNAADIPAIVALGSDARAAAVNAARPPSYPRPASHSGAWSVAHGSEARSDAASCANCHTRPSCTGCHTTPTPVIALLPPAQQGGPPGVTVRRTVHDSDVATRHGSLAAAGSLDCSSCHTRETCSGCHAGADSRAFHLPNFVERHAGDVFSGRGDCQSCHNTERFCRDCHVRTGVAAQPGMNAAFHTAQPMWVLSHGQAARTGMEACASCHRQNDCVRCHSAAGGWGVNPHGPGFAAERRGARNAATCRWCHLSDPVGR
jgi:hypothetical protein